MLKTAKNKFPLIKINSILVLTFTLYAVPWPEVH